jgi:hypothetical protein
MGAGGTTDEYCRASSILDSGINELQETSLMAHKKRGVARSNYVGGVDRGERNVTLLNILRVAYGLRVKPGRLFDSFS